MINLIKIRFSQFPEVTADSRPINLFKQGTNIKSYNYVKVLKQIMVIGTTTIRYNRLLSKIFYVLEYLIYLSTLDTWSDKPS